MQSGSLDELRSLRRTTVTTALRSMDPAVESLTTVGGVHNLRRHDEHLTLDIDTPALGDVLARLTAFGVDSLTAHPPTLEDLFLREYSDELATLGVVEGSPMTRAMPLGRHARAVSGRAAPRPVPHAGLGVVGQPAGARVGELRCTRPTRRPRPGRRARR